MVCMNHQVGMTKMSDGRSGLSLTLVSKDLDQIGVNDHLSF
jgi:hypothetical protein